MAPGSALVTVNRMERRHITCILGEDDLREELATCPFCDSSRTIVEGMLQPTPEVTRRRCPDCGCGFASRYPTAEYLQRYYSTYYDGEAERTHISTRRLTRHILRNNPLKPRSSLRILDFGGGDGGVSCELIRQLGVEESEVVIVDYNTVPHPAPPPGALLRYRPELSALEPGEEFDIVLASAVLEHTIDIRGSLQQLLERVAPGGLFYARTPYAMPIHRLLRRFGMYLDTHYPAHVYDLGPAFWNGCLTRLGFDRDLAIIRSQPSLVETEFSTNPVRTAVAHLLKWPWKVLGNRYGLVGGWEVHIRRNGSH